MFNRQSIQTLAEATAHLETLTAGPGAGYLAYIQALVKDLSEEDIYHWFKLIEWTHQPAANQSVLVILQELATNR